MAEFDPFERYDESVIVNPAYEYPYQGQNGGGYNDTVSTVGSQENTAWLREEVKAYYEEITKRDGLTPGSIDYNNFTKDSDGRLAVKVPINGIMTTKILYAKSGKPLALSTLKRHHGISLLKSLGMYTELSRRASAAALSKLDFEISRLDA